MTTSDISRPMMRICALVPDSIDKRPEQQRREIAPYHGVARGRGFSTAVFELLRGGPRGDTGTTRWTLPKGPLGRRFGNHRCVDQARWAGATRYLNIEAAIADLKKLVTEIQSARRSLRECPVTPRGYRNSSPTTIQAAESRKAPAQRAVFTEQVAQSAGRGLRTVNHGNTEAGKSDGRLRTSTLRVQSLSPTLRPRRYLASSFGKSLLIGFIAMSLTAPDENRSISTGMVSGARWLGEFSLD